MNPSHEQAAWVNHGLIGLCFVRPGMTETINPLLIRIDASHAR